MVPPCHYKSTMAGNTNVYGDVLVENKIIIIIIFQYLKPKKIDVKPRHKNKGKTNIARKKIIKEASRKVLISFY